jgi:uncharacterized protein DUF6636
VPGYRSFLAALCVAALLAVAASATAPAAPAADCSKATATQLVNDNKLNNFLLPDPVMQVLCGPFTGPGSTSMAVTIGAATCWTPQSWAVFTFDAGTWRLVHVQPAFLIPPLVAVGGDLRETTPIFRSTDPRCVPSGGTHTRTWHWDGSRFVAGPWKTKPAARTSASFYSPSRNISCEINDGRQNVGTFVYCQSWKRPESVKMGLDGRLKICRDKSTMSPHCLGDPGEHTPVLGYGKQVALKRFRCRSQQAGVTCTVIATGKGFQISRTAVRRIG